MRCLELFAGAGGATEGLIAAGFDVVRCIERDPDAHATALAAGHPSVCGDVRASDVYEGLPPVEALWASPPCQPFSSSGKRGGSTDERNGWPWTLDAVDFLRGCGHPIDWVICENVPGMLHHRKGCGRRGDDVDACSGCYYAFRILAAFRERFAHVGWRVIDAADQGVPQRRRRVFLVAGPRPAPWPAATHGDPAGGLKPWATLGEALGLRGDRAPVRGRSWAFVRQETTGSAAQTVDRPGPTLGTSGMIYLHATDPGRRGNKDPLAGSRPELLDQPSPTVLVREAKGVSMSRSNPNRRHAGVQGATDAAYLSVGIRRLRVDECARLQAFRDDYPWQGTSESRYRQVGNACCPPVVAALAGAVIASSRRTVVGTG